MSNTLPRERLLTVSVTLSEAKSLQGDSSPIGLRMTKSKITKHPLAKRVEIDRRFYVAEDLRYSSLLCYFDSSEILKERDEGIDKGDVGWQ